VNIYTIGHSGHDPDTFVALLRRHGVEAVADVRSQPFSRRFPHFRKTALADLLAAVGMRYVFLGRELGARREEPECFVDDAVRYDLVPALPAFREGLERVRRGARDYRLALMCAEGDPLQCHRSILVAPWLVRAGLDVMHILPDGNLLAHECLEEQLMEETGVAVADLFEDDPLARAYALKGRRMAYRRPRTHESGRS
jgi:uncharacterized protein (DUF488 family)